MLIGQFTIICRITFTLQPQQYYHFPWLTIRYSYFIFPLSSGIIYVFNENKLSLLAIMCRRNGSRYISLQFKKAIHFSLTHILCLDIHSKCLLKFHYVYFLRTIFIFLESIITYYTITRIYNNFCNYLHWYKYNIYVLFM